MIYIRCVEQRKTVGHTVVIKGKLPREDPVSLYRQFPRLILSIPKTLKFRLLNVVLLGLLEKKVE